MGVNITPGSGKVISSDTIAGEDYQRIKLVDGTAGGTTGVVVDANGNLRVVAGQPALATYSLPSGALAAASATDLLVVEAPSAGVIRLQRLVIWNPGSQTTAGIVDLQLIRKTSAGTGGAVTPNPLDSSDAAYGGLCRAGVTTRGADGAVLDTIGVYVPAAVAAFAPLVVDWSQSDSTKAPVILPGTGNGIALKHPGSTGAAGLRCSLVFTVGS